MSVCSCFVLPMYNTSKSPSGFLQHLSLLLFFENRLSRLIGLILPAPLCWRVVQGVPCSKNWLKCPASANAP